MANNYFQFSFEVKATPAEAEFARDLLVQISDYQEGLDEDGSGKPIEFDPWVVKFCDTYEQETVDCRIEERADGTYKLWFVSEESGSAEATADFLQKVMQHGESDLPAVFTYCYHCDKMRTDEFGGGAAVVTRDQVYYMDAYQWASKAVDRLKMGLEPQ